MDSMPSNRILPFDYIVLSTALAANAAGVFSLPLASDSWFELHYLLGTCTEDADTDFMPNNFSCKITDQSTGRLLSSDRVPQRNFCGPANTGLRLLRPVRFPPLGNIVFDILNLTGNSNTVTVCLRGLKIFDLTLSS